MYSFKILRESCCENFLETINSQSDKKAKIKLMSNLKEAKRGMTEAVLESKNLDDIIKDQQEEWIDKIDFILNKIVPVYTAGDLDKIENLEAEFVQKYEQSPYTFIGVLEYIGYWDWKVKLKEEV